MLESWSIKVGVMFSLAETIDMDIPVDLFLGRRDDSAIECKQKKDELGKSEARAFALNVTGFGGARWDVSRGRWAARVCPLSASAMCEVSRA